MSILKAHRGKKLQEYKKSGARIDTLVRELNKPLVVNVKPAKGKKAASLKVKSNFTSPQFEKKKIVEKAKERIQAGTLSRWYFPRDLRLT